MTPEAFAAAAERDLAHRVATDRNLQLSMVRLSGLDRLQRSPRGDEMESLLGAVGAAVRAVSLGGAMATQLAAGRFAVRHAGTDVEKRLGQTLDGVVAAADGVAVARQTLALNDPALSPAETCAALRYVLERSASADGAVQITSLTDALTARLNDTAARVQAAKAVIDSRGFHVLYQPIVGLTDGKVHHNEALARLRSSEPIDDFVTFAETIGFVLDFDLAVAREVFDHLCRLGRAGKHPSLAINVSARSLDNDQFVERLLKLHGAAGATGRHVMIEVTESFPLVDLERANCVVQRFRAAGCKVCLDDFGAGAAAFHDIRALSVDYVKLDGAVVQRVLATDLDTAVLRSMVDLCRSLRIDTIGEMVENEEQAATLRAFGVGFGQGFLFGRPADEPVGGAVLPPPCAARRRGAVEAWA